MKEKINLDKLDQEKRERFLEKELNKSPKRYEYTKSAIYALDPRDREISREVRRVLPTISTTPVPTKKVKVYCENCGVMNWEVDPETKLCNDTIGCAERAEDWD